MPRACKCAHSVAYITCYVVTFGTPIFHPFPPPPLPLQLETVGTSWIHLEKNECLLVPLAADPVAFAPILAAVMSLPVIHRCI